MSEEKTRNKTFIDRIHTNATHWRTHLLNHSHQDKPATVRIDNTPSPDEFKYVRARKKQAYHTLSSDNPSLQPRHTPTIALACSGGSFRAMFSTLGLLRGLEDIGLLDAVTYFGAISGASWLLLPWLVSKQPLTDFATQFTHVAQNGLWLGSNNAYKSIATLIGKKYVSKQRFSLIDWYGILLADKLLTPYTNKPFSLQLHDLASNLDASLVPCPVIAGALQQPQKEYHWLEYSPHEIGSTFAQAHIKPWALGRTFAQGRSIDSPPPPTLATILGILGSSFSASMHDVVQQAPRVFSFIENGSIMRTLQEYLSDVSLAHKKVTSYVVPNFAYKIKKSPLRKSKKLHLVDGGYISNIPLAPLLHPQRKVDCIIVLDCRQDGEPTYFRIACRDAQKRGYKLPPIDFNQTKHNPVTTFSAPGCVSIIYIPLRKNPAYSSFDPAQELFCSTLNFRYSPEQATELSNLVKHTIKQHEEHIRNEIRSIIHESQS